MDYNLPQDGHHGVAGLANLIVCFIGTILTFITWDDVRIYLSIILLIISITTGIFSIRYYRAGEKKTRLEIEKMEREKQN